MAFKKYCLRSQNNPIFKFPQVESLYDFLYYVILSRPEMSLSLSLSLSLLCYELTPTLSQP